MKILAAIIIILLIGGVGTVTIPLILLWLALWLKIQK